MADITAVTMFKDRDGRIHSFPLEAHASNTRLMLTDELNAYIDAGADSHEIDPVDFIMEHAEQILAILSRPVVAP